MDILEKLGLILLPILLTAFFYSVIPRKREEREKFTDAATIFRSKILTELEGIYPIPAVKAYREYYKKQQYEGALAWSIIPDIQKPGEIGPVETFNNIVAHLLSFTERKRKMIK